MTIYIGSLGRMINLPNIESQSMKPSETMSFQTTLEGRVVAQRLPASRREWSLGAKMYRPTELAVVESFANGEWGSGPFFFVPAEAPVVNVLTPDVARLDPGVLSSSTSPDGPLLTPDGWAARSVSRVQTIGFFGTSHTPVVPGVPVTGSAYVTGADGGVRLYWYDRDGAQISWNTSPVRSTASEVVRSYVTAVPPEGAVSCRLSFVFGTQATRPAITWTDQPYQWGDGYGCEKAVVLGPSRDLVKALRNSPDSGRWTTIGFTVREVG